MQRSQQISRRYNDLRSGGTAAFTPFEVNTLRIWLEDEVIPSLTEVTRQPRFRDLATFTIRVLAPGADSKQRRAVDEVDRGLASTANALLAVVEYPLISQRLPGPTSNSMTVQLGSIEIGTECDGPIANVLGALRDNPELEVAALRRVARSDSGDLVQLNDYFSTRQEFVALEDGTRLQCGDMINSLDPRLLAIGDLVSRSMRRRIDLRLQAILTVRKRINQVLTQPEIAELDLVKIFRRANDELQTALRRLEALVFADSEAILRDSCMTLTQVYAAMHPAPVLGWLGISEELVLEHQGIFPSLLRGHRGSAVHDHIARAVADMEILHRGSDDCSTQLERVIASGGLVIDMQTCSAWWEGDPLDIESGSKNFEFLVALARRAMHGQDATERDVYPDDRDGGPSRSAMPTCWSRLGKILPGSLSPLITRGGQPRSYRLHLERQRIHIIE